MGLGGNFLMEETMPLLKPLESETKSEYIHRFMADNLMIKEFKDPKQRLAVCSSIWEKKTVDKLTENFSK